MKTLKGPALFLAQFAGDAAPFNSWDAITRWAADCGYRGVQIPSWDGRLFDLNNAAKSEDYCAELLGVAAANGVTVTELSTHLQGQLVAVHPAYDEAFDGFADPAVIAASTSAVPGPASTRTAIAASSSSVAARIVSACPTAGRCGEISSPYPGSSFSGQLPASAGPGVGFGSTSGFTSATAPGRTSATPPAAGAATSATAAALAGGGDGLADGPRSSHPNVPSASESPPASPQPRGQFRRLAPRTRVAVARNLEERLALLEVLRASVSAEHEPGDVAEQGERRERGARARPRGRPIGRQGRTLFEPFLVTLLVRAASAHHRARAGGVCVEVWHEASSRHPLRSHPVGAHHPVAKRTAKNRDNVGGEADNTDLCKALQCSAFGSALHAVNFLKWW